MQYQNLDNFSEHVDNLLACLPKSTGTVDLQPLFFKLTLDTTTALLFGQSVHSLKEETDPKFSAFAESFDIAQGGLAKRFRLSMALLLSSSQIQSGLLKSSSFRGNVY